MRMLLHQNESNRFFKLPRYYVHLLELITQLDAAVSCLASFLELTSRPF